MTTPKTEFAGLALIAATCAGFTLGLTAPAGAVAKSRRSGEGCPGSDAFAKPRFRVHR